MSTNEHKYNTSEHKWNTSERKWNTSEHKWTEVEHKWTQVNTGENNKHKWTSDFLKSYNWMFLAIEDRIFSKIFEIN